MKTTRLLVVIPLGAVLLYSSGTVTNPPGVERRPAHFIATLPPQSAPSAAASNAALDLTALLDKVDYEPAREGVLEAVLAHGTLGERRKAIRELRKLGTTSAIQTLSMALYDHDARVRRAALDALSHVGGDEALAAIASVTADIDPTERVRATEALGEAGGYSAADYLELALRDEDARVRATAVVALGDLNDSQSVNIISSALRDPDTEVRERALQMLDELNDDALFHTLYPAL